MNLVELAEQNLEKFGEITSVIYNDTEFTNLQLFKKSNKLANGLKKLGISQGDKVLVMLMNSPDVLVSYQGILKAGAAILPVLFLLTPKEINHILMNSEAKAIITTKDFVDNIFQAKEGVETLENVIIIEDEEVSGALNLNDVLKDESDKKPDIVINDNDMAVLLYTSGTTGVPKGVILTHKNLYSNSISLSERDNPKPGAIRLFMLPLSHSFGLTAMNFSLLFDKVNVMMAWFDTEEACRLIEKYKITGFAGIPAIFTLLLNSPEITDKYDLSSLDYCASGSAPLPIEVLKGFEKKFNCKILEGYGLSEAAPVVTSHIQGKERKVGSIGEAIPGIEVKIVDEKGNEMPVGEVGEMIVKGPNISPGYLNLPKETENTFRDGWLHTGDLAKIDEDNYFYIVDRKKDLIIRGGFNIIPRDVEEVLYQHPAVTEAAVIGISDNVMGEEVKAYVALREGKNDKTTKDDIINHCMSHLAKYKCPKYVEFIDQLPRNPIGKISKKDLKNMNQ